MNRLHENPYPLGAIALGNGLKFTFASKAESCGVILYDKGSGRMLKKLTFSEEDRVGNIHTLFVDDVDCDRVSYLFFEDGRLVEDRYARDFAARHPYGRVWRTNERRSCVPAGEFDWRGDRRPRIAYEDMIGYCLHVRGFTRHASSGVAHRGTFLGVVEKIPYLRKTGITTLEFQPIYEFAEMEEAQPGVPNTQNPGDVAERRPVLNYWGYKQGYYYAPKQAYGDADAVTECKEMIRALHENGMEAILQFYFPKETAAGYEILDIMRYWLLEYHVDGFHLMGEGVPATTLAGNPLFADCKLFYDHFRTEELYGAEEPKCRNLAVYKEDYQYTLRRFLKGDEGMLDSVLYQMKHNPPLTGRIHFLTNYGGFTLADLVTYERKHNENNGEDNRDGTDYNCSWNCGEEGPSRKKRIRSFRRRQIRNALTLLMLSQSTPLIFMGDEFGNSQNGNNNPYCQDNSVTWLNWADLERNAWLYDFWRMLVDLRRQHPILHRKREFQIMDSLSCGYPDLSYHGRNAWRPQTENYNRHIGILYCGKYASGVCGEDDFFYLAINMHWENHELALPKLPKGLRWEMLFSTVEEESAKDQSPVSGASPSAWTESLEEGRESMYVNVHARSICVFWSRGCGENAVTSRKRGAGKAAAAAQE